MATKVKGFFKGFKYISQLFVYKEHEMEIGYPTDVRHVAHIGWDSSSMNAPTWMNEFRTASDFSSSSLSNYGQSRETSWASQGFMTLRQKVQPYLREELSCSLVHLRWYKSNIDWNKLRPMILKRINNRAKDYPLKSMIPVANDVLEARKLLIQGVCTLLKVLPVKSCKHCPEVYIGSSGHRIKTCHGFKRIRKDQEHKWITATVDDILTPVEAFHLQTMFQPTIKHEQRFDFERVPAIVELCFQAGAQISEEILYNHNQMSESIKDHDQQLVSDGQLDGFDGQLAELGQQTLDAWERLRIGVQKLLFVYTAKVCEHCSEVHIGPSGNKARVCGVFRYEGWRGAHHWKKAEVDDLIPLNVVWHRRPQDPRVLVDGGRGFYGHAPAVVELCMQAGARVPKKYFCMMKLQGLTPSFVEQKGVKVQPLSIDEKIL